MNSIWSHRRLRFVIAGAATLVTGAALASAALAGLHALDLGPAAASQYPGKKVTVCHRTHSKKHPWVQIRISTHALKAHLRHGDFVVDANNPCPPTSAASAKNKDHGKGKGKHGKGSAAKNDNHGKNKGGKGKGKLGKSGATTNKSNGGKGKGNLGKSGATTNKSHGGKGKGNLGKSDAAKSKTHGNNNGGKGHGKK
jgi:hypothetical protein